MRRCSNCNGFLRSQPDRTDYDSGIDAEYEHGTFGAVIKTYWQTETDVRVCRICGENNKEEVEP